MGSKQMLPEWSTDILKIVDQPVNIAVALSRLIVGKFGGKIGGQEY